MPTILPIATRRSTGQNGLERLRTKLAAVRQSAANALIALMAEKEASDRAKTAWTVAKASESQAQAELEAIRQELKKSWELEAEAQTYIQKGKEELESKLPCSTCPLALLCSRVTYAYCTEH